MIQLIDLIKQAGFELGSYKIHCATGRSPTPLEAFYEGDFKEWQEYQNMKNFQCDHVVSLILLLAGSGFLLGYIRLMVLQSIQIMVIHITCIKQLIKMS